MSNLEFIGIVFLYLFAIACFAAGIAFTAWWHIATGTMTALLARAIYQEY